MRTVLGGPGEARGRRQISQKYLEVAGTADSGSTAAANNVVVGLAVLADIAAADAICLAARGERYSGPDHGEAAQLLRSVDVALAGELAKLVRLKPAAHYGHQLLTDSQRKQALRSAGKLVAAATERT